MPVCEKCAIQINLGLSTSLIQQFARFACLMVIALYKSLWNIKSSMLLMLKNRWLIFWKISVMTSVGRKLSYLEVLTRSIIGVPHGSLNLLTDKNKYESSQQHHWPPTLKHQLSSLHNSLYTNDLTGPSVKNFRFRIFLFIPLPKTIILFNHLSHFPFSMTRESEKLKIFTSFEQNMDFVKLSNFPAIPSE